MPRPRVHDPDRVLDAVDELVARSGPAAATIRAVETATGVSNGAIYHGFGSRAGLLAGAWLRAAGRFLALQRELVDAAPGPVEAVIAAADASAAFAEAQPDSSRLLLAMRRDELLSEELPPETADALRSIDAGLIGLLIELATALWDRRDAGAVDTVTTCVVDLPTAIVLSRNRFHSPHARAHLHAAVRAVLAAGPPSPKGSTP